jgi:hypothetical protein
VTCTRKVTPIAREETLDGLPAPAQALASTGLEQAMTDMRQNRFSTRQGQRAYWEAQLWITADDREWPYSFVNVCATLGLDLDLVRHRMLDQAAGGGPPTGASPPNRQPAVAA